MFKGELSVKEANNILRSKMDIEYVQFAKNGKVYVKIDRENSEFYQYHLESKAKKQNTIKNSKSNIKK